jgi:polysaccharide pyruvyl transferase WcaK-like protein
MIIHHYYPHTLNVGDYFVRDGIRKLLREQIPSATFVDFPVNKPSREGPAYGLRGDNLDRSNREADLIVIGGSNLYQSSKHGTWGVTTDLDSLKKISRPVMLIGLGAGSSFKDKAHLCSPAVREEIRFLNQLAVGSSVRDSRTEQFLDGLGLRGHTMTGCPATFVFERPLHFNTHSEVAISFPPIRLKKKHPLHFFRLVQAIKRYRDHCASRRLTPFFACHDRRDVDAARSLGKEATEVFYSENAEDYYARYAAVRFTVGFRMHAAIISLSLGVPFIPVSFDLRGLAFVETYDSVGWNVDATRWGLSKTLVSRTQQILDAQESPFANFFAHRQKNLQVIRQFVSRCLEKAKRSGR